MTEVFPRVLAVADSSAISEIAYDPASRRMRIFFSSTNSLWEYEGVYPSDFAALACAHSVGLVFNERIRNRYQGYRIIPPPTEGASLGQKEQESTATREKNASR